MDNLEKVNMCCAYLIKLCLETNATKMTINQEGFHRMEESGSRTELGDWEVIVRKARRKNKKKSNVQNSSSL